MKNKLIIVLLLIVATALVAPALSEISVIQADFQFNQPFIIIEKKPEPITAIIEFPLEEEISVFNVDGNSLILNGIVHPESYQIGDANKNGILDMTVQFNGDEIAQKILAHIPPDFEVKQIYFTIEGNLTYGETQFSGTDSLRMIYNKK